MYRAFALTLCHVLTWTALAVAQDRPSASTRPTAVAPAGEVASADTVAAAEPRTGGLAKPAVPTPAAGLEEVQPEVYYVPDAKGNLVPMLGFTLDEFTEAFRLMRLMSPAVPSSGCVVQRASITGRVLGDRAELTVDLDVLQQRDGVVRAALGLDQAILPLPPKPPADGKNGQNQHASPESARLEYQAGGDGYVWWISGKARQRHHLSLTILAPVERLGDESRLTLRLPTATRCEVRLNVPTPGARGRTTGTALVETQPGPDGKGTQFTIRGPREDFQFTWRDAPRDLPAGPVVLKASGQLSATIGRQGVDTQATFRVEGSGGPLSRFQIRLPRGTELTTTETLGYRLVELPLDPPGKPSAIDAKAKNGAQPATSPAPRRVVEVRLDKPSSEPVEVRLAARTPHARIDAACWLELGDFDVLDCSSQSGHLAVVVTDDLFATWDPQGGIRQVESPPEAIRRDDVTAAFSYAGRGSALRARVVPLRTWVSVEPEYLIQIDSRQASLDATLRYTIRGKGVSSVRIALAGWEFLDVGPEDVVAVDGVEIGSDGVLTVPLKSSTTRRLILQLKARRPLPAEANSVRFGFPAPEATSPGPAAVAILPADNIRLVPDASGTTGLTRQPTAAPMALPERQQEHLFYRGEIAAAVFAASRTIHSRAVSVEADARVALADQMGSVEQTLSYRIENEPLDQLSLAVPDRLARMEGLRMLLDGRPVVPAVSSDAATSEDDGLTRMIVPLKPGRIGAAALVVRHPLPLVELAPRSTILRDVPLVTPLDGQLKANRLRVNAPAELRLTYPSGPWQAHDGGMAFDPSAAPGDPIDESGGASTLALTSDRPLDRVEIAVSRDSPTQSDRTVLERVWFQTWLAELDGRATRQDRAFFRFTSNQRRLAVELPEGAVRADLGVFLDGQPVALTPDALTPDAESRLSLELPRQAEEHSFLLELRYHLDDGWKPRGESILAPPRLGDNAWIRRVYWQVILPPGVHALNTPPGFVAESRWAWTGLFWGRQPLLEQRELEDWIGVRNSPETADADNAYLFGAFGPVEPCRFATANRSWVVLCASGAALMVGLVLVYLPVCRHPACLVGLTVALAAVGLAWPEPTLLLLQAASIGLALTVPAGLLKRAVSRRRLGPDSTSILAERDTTRTQPIPHGPASPSAANAIPPSASGVASAEAGPGPAGSIGSDSTRTAAYRPAPGSTPSHPKAAPGESPLPPPESGQP